MTTVNDLLKEKPPGMWSIEPEASVLDAITMMAEKNVGALLVTENGRLVGLLSERDYARKVVLEGHSSSDTQVREIMTARVAYVGLTDTVEECMALMTDKRIRHLPVLDDSELRGMVSIGDLVRAIIADQQFQIKQLEHYISGSQ